MKTGNGKIANLPAEIRDELNYRITNGEPGNEIVDWLNSKPEVMEVITKRFDGTPISEQNLSEWRKRGYQKWLAFHKIVDESSATSDNAEVIAETGIDCDKLLLTLTAAYAEMIQHWIITPCEEMTYKLAVYKNITNGVLSLRRGEIQKVRLEIERERLELLREMRRDKSAGKGGGPGKGRAFHEECRHSSFELRHSSASAEAGSQRQGSPATEEPTPAPVIPERDDTPDLDPAMPAPPPAIDYEMWREFRSPSFVGVPRGGSRQKPDGVGAASHSAALPETGPTPAPKPKPSAPPAVNPGAKRSAPTLTPPFVPNQVRPRDPNTTIIAIRDVPPLVRHNTTIPVAR